jgi:stage II sporulation protein D
MQRIITLLLGLLIAHVAGAADQIRPIRVWLKTLGECRALTASAEQGFLVRDADGAKVARILPGQSLPISMQSTAILVRIAGKQKPVSNATLTPLAGGVTLTVGGRKAIYRGWLDVTVVKGKLRIINEVAVESYLLGVVPAEMPSKYPADAIRAQAIVARTFALKRMCGSFARDFDITDGDGSQVYLGMGAEKPESTQAVFESAGLVLICDDGYCDAVYSADCGGFTAAADEVGFGSKQPYLSGVCDTGPDGDFCAGTLDHEWTVDVPADRWATVLKQLGFSVGKLKSIAVTKTGPSGRAQQVHVEGAAKSVDVSGVAIRKAMGYDVVKSTLFSIEKTDGGWAINGKGHGHGVGLCQHGAAGRAKAGQSYAQILAAYFPGARLLRADPDPRLALPVTPFP